MILTFQAHRCIEQLFIAKDYIASYFERNVDREGLINPQLLPTV